MKSNYKRIGDFIRPIKVKNIDSSDKSLLGININKYFMPSVANVVGTDLSRYKIVKKGQFSCNRMHVGRDKRLPVALSNQEDDFIVSPAYDVFEIFDKKILLPEYLMMWFSRKEFDRNAWFYTDADVRGGLHWDAFCNIQLPVPDIEKQKAIVKEYNTIANRIKLNEQLNQKLEETAQAIYKEWFVDFEFPDDNGEPYKSSGGDMVFNEVLEKDVPVGWRVQFLGEILANKGYIRGPFGSSLKKDDMQLSGVPVYEQQHAIYNHRKFRYFISNDKHNHLKRFTVQPNDVVISCSGTLGKIIMIKEKDPIGIINQALLILRIDEYKIKPMVFKYFLTSSDGNKLLIENSSGSAQINIAKRKIIESIPIAISTDIQTLFESYLLTIDTKLDFLLTENNQLEILKSILLSKMTKV